MVRLGEACSHVTALLTYVVKENAARQKTGRDSCTSAACAWLPPPKNVSMRRLQHCITLILMFFLVLQVHAANFACINFVGNQELKRQACETGEVESAAKKRKKYPPPSEDKLHTFFKTLNKSNTKPALLKVTPPY